MSEKNKKAGVALVGLGNYSTTQLAPALQETNFCYLAGIVTGSPAKVDYWQKKYKIAGGNIYSYLNFDSIKDNQEIDIIYIVLPNHMHAEFTIRGLKAGKHVICEKPMALSVNDCDSMISAAVKANKTLSIGYRLHFDPFHSAIIRLAREKVYGGVKKIDSAFSIQTKKGEWRLNKKMAGGGPLMDLGIYCIQAACYLTGQEPLAVTARQIEITDNEKFIDIEEKIVWQMEMPDGIVVNCESSYSEEKSFLAIETSEGWFSLEPAFDYTGINLTTSDGNKFELPVFYQQAKQLDGIAMAIQNNEPVKVPGEMGRRDMRIITAIYESMKTESRVLL